ncbi:hypothetical protein NIA69_19855 [Gemmiger formicilis]|nr:hypothetical protein [Gemmiger formicilis]
MTRCRADLHGLRRGLHPPRAAGRPPGSSAQKHAPLNYSVPLPAAEESTDTRPGPEELAIFGEQYADTLRRMQTELSALERTVLMAGLEGRTPHRPRGSWDFPPKTWPMRWPVRAASCAVRPQPRIQAICLRHISTCPQ